MKNLGLGLVVLMLVACGGNKGLVLNNLDNSPDLIKNVSDFPKQSITYAEIAKNGYIRVIAESAAGQSQYNAIEAARVIAREHVLEITYGVRHESETLVKTGVLAEQDIKALVTGNVRSFDCGLFYNQSTGTGYSCMEANVR